MFGRATITLGTGPHSSYCINLTAAVLCVSWYQVKPYLPYEMTHEGMLLRLSAYIQHQDFCSPKPEIWPPLSSIKVLLSQPGQSCKDACWANSKFTRLLVLISVSLYEFLTS